MIRLIALDLDDTLLKTDLSISPRNQKAIALARSYGVHIVLASGRALAAMERFALQLNVFDYEGFLISDNGSTIHSTKPVETLLSHTIEKSLLNQLFDFFDFHNLPVQVYSGKTILVTKENPTTSIDMKLSGYEKHFVPRLKEEINFLPRKLVIPGDPARLVQTLETLRSQFGERINAFISKPYFLEVLPAQADKGSALEWIGKALGIDRSEILSVGDAANDLGMIRYAGYGIAIGNAIEAVKAQAKAVCALTHEEDGVAEILEQFVFPQFSTVSR